MTPVYAIYFRETQNFLSCDELQYLSHFCRTHMTPADDVYFCETQYAVSCRNNVIKKYMIIDTTLHLTLLMQKECM